MKKEDYSTIWVSKKFQLKLTYLCLRRKHKTYELLIKELLKESQLYRKSLIPIKGIVKS
jgi:hypothetical protein